ncbi:ADP-ribose pyrophosphatase YjhB (NUDIX family) [Paenibacillus cellulosilyticus]|uniref:ADP-ribose pyrophosphatase YjhB (NUDIX family) n=1 Tax=Paenibacillus cellulosilyticus TaxID=375489 RepID=A0A2V2YV43_9BACL|nr:NUDIX domain-containing protein [Paenibacillus cellulosilyticus]PWW04896.1 ADP-ribose pyrophosphatase YjhB (NUDIX family) [Paenibacillus cellulosilyticus]QKS46001.1 NUDIX domain-containing protein [Paenibacillus cellulosilyticus]
MFIVNVVAAICRDDQWLVITRSAQEEHAGGTLSLVGGKVDLEDQGPEIVERTVKREVFEEVGVEIADTVTFVYSSSFVTGDGRHVINMVFLCDYVGGTAHSKSPDEVEDVHWLTYEEIMNHPKTMPWTQESLRRAALVNRR